MFADDPTMSRYIRGKLARKVLFIGIMGGTVGTGKFSLKYGADVIAEDIQSQTATSAWTTTTDFQPIVDGRWCPPEANVSLTVTEAPGATLKFIVGLLEAGAGRFN